MNVEAKTRDTRRAGEPTQGTGGPLLLYDQMCSVCRRFVSLLIRADAHGSLRIAPLQSPIGDVVRRDHPEFSARDSALWIQPNGHIVGYSDAILDSLEYLGGAWVPLARALRSVPRSLRDQAYTTFARNRNLFARLGLDELDERSLQRMLRDTVGDTPRAAT